MGTILVFIGMCVIAMIFTPKEKIEELAREEYERAFKEEWKETR